jgi:hypothetical protein
MRKTFAVASAAAIVLLAATPVRAHHAFSAEFDVEKKVKFKGTVTKMEWINPHAWIHMDVKSTDGKVVNWMVECGTPNTLFRKGLNKNSLPVGTQILVDGYQAKDGSLRANGRDVTFPDGRKVFIGNNSPDAPKE